MCGIIAEAPSIMYMISAEKILMPVRISRSGFQRQGDRTGNLQFI